MGICLWAVVGAWYLMPPKPSIVEYWFSRNWYRWILSWTIPLTQGFGFPLVLGLVPLACTGFIILWIRNWRNIRNVRRQSHWAGFGWGARRFICVLPVLILWFLAFWGAGYRRLPVAQRLHFAQSAISEADMVRLRGLLLDRITANMVLPQNRDPSHSIRAISLSMARLVERWDARPIRLPARVKFTPRGLLMCNGTAGLCSPFTLEPLVDRGLPEAAAVSAAAHELGHIAGFCAEDEASFVGYLAGLQAEDPFAGYACSLYAYMDAIDGLARDDYVKAFDVLPDQARQDVRAAQEAYRRYRIEWFGRISWAAYDRYLQAQGIGEGVRNYSHGITLLCYALCDSRQTGNMGKRSWPSAGNP